MIVCACSGGTEDRPPLEAPPSRCDAPIGLEDTSTPGHVVGDGTPASCTHAALAQAIAGGGSIVFDCGAGTVTIDVEATLALRTDVDTILDGGNTIVLDGRDAVRLFTFDGSDFRRSNTRVVLQRITLANGRAPATDFTPEDPARPECAWGYKDGRGGAIRMFDGRLHVVDVTFENHAAAPSGPDTGGGAIYAAGAREVIVVGSRFTGCSGANGGAIGLLQTDGVFVDTVFADNEATGRGQNFGGAGGCPPFNHDAQGGAGGNGGAVVIDGDAVERSTFCGVTFRGNTANELGTVFRTPNTHRGTATFDLCRFEGNHAGDGGGAIWMQDMDFSMSGSTLDGNSSDGLGGAVRIDQGPHGSTLRIQNSTFFENVTTRSLGGALVFAGDGVVKNCTFADNRADGGEGFFGAALVAHGEAARGLVIENTVFSNNRDDHEWTPMTCSVVDPVTPEPLRGGGNVQWPRLRNGPNHQPDNPCAEGVTFEDPLLSGLDDHGGPHPTLLPGAGSVAIGMGANCPPIDQRGAPRPETGCTAGAVEP